MFARHAKRHALALTSECERLAAARRRARFADASGRSRSCTGNGPGKALANKATAIQTAVNAGNKATACAGVTYYLGLVRAQTGKKLTPEQANQLTTDATDLADALGC